jgi:hypothetical protein
LHDRLDIEDLVPDRDKPETSPSYIEIESASVEETSHQLRFTVRFQTRLPARSPRDERFTVGFDLQTDQGKAFSLIGVLSEEGWDSSFQEKESITGPRGDFSVGERELRFVVGRNEFGSYDSFNWAAGGAMTRDVPNAAPLMLGWDIVPNNGPTAFPAP